MDLGPWSRYYSVPSLGHGENRGESQWLVIISKLRHLMCLSSWSFWVLGHSYFLDMPGPWKYLQSPGCEPSAALPLRLWPPLWFQCQEVGGLDAWWFGHSPLFPNLRESFSGLLLPCFSMLFSLCCTFPTPHLCSSTFLPTSSRNSWNCPGLILCFEPHTFPEVLNRELRY